MTPRTEIRPATEPSGCPRTADLPAYWLDAPSAAEKADWDRHLQTCPACRAARGEWEALFARMQIPEAATPPVDLVARVLAKIPRADGETAVPLPPSPAPRTATLLPLRAPLLKIAAGLLLLAGLALLLFLSLRITRPERDALAPALAHQTPPAPHPQTPGPSTAPALRRSLDWLKSAQAEDGRWDAQTWGAQPQFGVGVSALALLALIHKEPHVFQSASSESVARGIQYLVNAMDDEGLIGPACSGATYNQGLATLALIEAQARAPRPEWEAAARRAVEWLVRAQHAEGGWGYIAGDAPNSSATIWPLQALIRAESEGFADTRPAIERGLDWLTQSVADSGIMNYQATPSSPGSPITLTAAGAVCFLLQPRNDAPPPPMARRLIAALRRLIPTGEPADGPNYYQHYFVGKAFELAADADALQRLAASRTRWQNCQVAAGPTAGSWESVDPWGGVGGRVYSTALASLAWPAP